MSVDFTKVQLSSTASSNKVLKEGSGTFSVAALGGAGETFSSVTIPHNFTSDNLIFQVGTSQNIAGDAITVVIPWRSGDGRVTTYARLNNTNLEIYCCSV